MRALTSGASSTRKVLTRAWRHQFVKLIGNYSGKGVCFLKLQLPGFVLRLAPFLLLKLSVKQISVDYQGTVPGSLLLPLSQPLQIRDPLLPSCLSTETSSYQVSEERGPENRTIRLADTFSHSGAVCCKGVTCAAWFEHVLCKLPVPQLSLHWVPA